MKHEPNIKLLDNLRMAIARHLEQIEPILTSDYKLTFVARVSGKHSKTIIVTNDDDLIAVAQELTSSDDLLTVTA